ncbi:periphilin-1-like [Entelurus aequoreus]|uniref:periphilin-1-like n=1 Tax=Entelurus aequoreus TaxID=161455 RepID=UPI002B1DE536|nr:periphilin-1-like [Entelurus aequoreus]XP_061892012.1 periphilin-1-like [Entelurus aequoreus]
MAFRQRWPSLREQYEQHISEMDTREVTLHRVVNIVERRNPHPEAVAYDRAFDDPWYNDVPNYLDSPNYQEGPNFHGEDRCVEDDYPPSRYYDDNPNYGNVPSESPPHHQEPPYQRPRYGRDDLRHQLRSRQNVRPGPYYNTRGRGHSQNQKDRNHHRHSKNESERFSGKKKGPPPAKKTSSSESDKGSAQPPKNKTLTVTVPTPSSPVEESPQTSSLSMEQPSDSGADVEEKVVVVEVAPPSAEAKTTQDEVVMARRSEAIKAKALDIKKHFKQDCETFITVVKMLVSKEPTLETLLQEALHANLSEMNEHCLTALRRYIKELDEALELPATST